MSQVKIQGNASGTGIFTIASPNSNNNRTMTLSDTDGTIFISPGNGVQVQTSSGPAARTITAGTGISVTNGDGTSGNPTITNTGVTSVNGNTGAVTISSGAPAAYDVGAYVIAAKTASGTSNTSAGETQAGSSLRFAEASPGINQFAPITMNADAPAALNPGLSGTWRAMMPAGNGTGKFGNNQQYILTLWCRVS